MGSGPSERQFAGRIRLALASELGNDLDGAWWPHTPSLADELAELVEALGRSLGVVTDISVNWSALQGVPDLDALNYRGAGVHGIGETRDQRVMTITGSRARANVLVIPCRTNRALAVMVLRQAADLPIIHAHVETQAFRAAEGIVRAARAESAARRACE